MRVNIEHETFVFSQPLEEPTWSRQVPRWYQLDGAAMALADMFSRKPRDMDFLILASPLASNFTDWEFAQSGAQHAQKFVHTLPNIRASMALMAANHTCDCLCLQKGPKTEAAALTEFFSASQFKSRPALALMHFLEIDDTPQKRQVYRTILVSASPDGDWNLLPVSNDDQKDFAVNWGQEPFAQTADFEIGPWKWEKIN